MNPASATQIIQKPVIETGRLLQATENNTSLIERLKPSGNKTKHGDSGSKPDFADWHLQTAPFSTQESEPSFRMMWLYLCTALFVITASILCKLQRLPRFPLCQCTIIKKASNVASNVKTSDAFSIIIKEVAAAWKLQVSEAEATAHAINNACHWSSLQVR